jgi:transcriptional regulator with XRE-family HTH domain
LLGDLVRALHQGTMIDQADRGMAAHIVACSRLNALVRCPHTLGHKRYHVNFNLYNVPMKAIQIRMARAAVGWGVRELAEKASVTANTVTRIENGADAKQSTMDALQQALETAGVEFTNGEQPGVRLTKVAKAQSPEPVSASNPMAAAKSVRRKTAKATEKKR